MATNPWDNDPIVQSPGIIYGGPDPAEARAEEAASRDVIRTDIAVEGNTRSATGQAFDQAAKLRDAYLKSPAVQRYEEALPIFVAGLQTGDTPQGDLQLVNSYAKIMDPGSVVRTEEGESVEQTATMIDQTIQRAKKELDGQGRFTDKTRRQLRDEIFLRVRELNRAYNGERLRYNELAPRYGIDPSEVIGTHLGSAKTPSGETYLDAIGAYSASLRQDAAGQGGEGDEWTVADAKRVWGTELYDARGNPLGPEGGEGFDASGKSQGLFNSVTDSAPSQAIAKEAKAQNDIKGAPGVFDLAKQGITLGLSDEAAGVGTVISEALMGNFDIAENYNRGRDVANYRLDQARERTGWMGTGAEVLGGLASGGIASLPQMTVRQAATGGAAAGALGGFGYGEGVEGRTISTIAGAALGGALGAGGQKVGDALTRRAALGAARTSNADDIAVANAARAEGVDVNRAMMDPSGQRNRIYRADASIAGGPTIQRGMERIEGQIEGRVASLGSGGTPMTPQRGGDVLKGAGARMVQKTRGIKDAKYTRAERLAGDTRIEAVRATQTVDEMLAELGQNPAANAKSIAELQTIRSDLTGHMPVEARRDILSTFRQKLRNGDLVLGKADARTAQLENALSEDIQVGLTQQGKPEAARAYEAADKAYAARMQYIKGTVQRLIGKPDANVPAETVFTRFKGMAQGKDAAGLRRFYASLNPEERADVAATFAESLGKNNKGDFTVTQFLRQSEGLSDQALATIFGRDGAESVRNLRVIGRRVEGVTSAMNSRKSGSAAGMGGLRGWLSSLLLGGGGAAGGMLSGNATVTAAGAAVAGAAAAKGAQSYLSARLLMSPKITKWVRQAPETTDPATIDRHFGRLAEIARAEPALAGDIKWLQDAIIKAANDNPGVARSVAEEQDRK